MKYFKDKHTTIIVQKHDKRRENSQSFETAWSSFPSNKEFKNFVFLIERKYPHKIWWKLLSKEVKKSIIYYVFHCTDSIYELTPKQISELDSQREFSPLTKEIRDYKIKILTGN